MTVEILVIVNSYGISSSAIQAFNKETHDCLRRFANRNNTPDFYLTPLLYEDLSGHQTGAGLPRKIGMDRAVADFQQEGNPNGILISLDADCTVDTNYLSEIFLAFQQYGLKSATIEFHHPVEHLPENDSVRKATEAYEEYLRYYRAALEYIGYPYAYHTIGSAFAVTAETYKQVGGMGQQQAGEDFYFLQKVFPLGKTQFIRSTCVYPAARISDRVPFGTGPVVAKMILQKEIRKYSYQVNAFEELKCFLDRVPRFYRLTREEIVQECRMFPEHLQTFLQQDDFFAKIQEINRHTANIVSFKKRFFSYFNAFKLLKYLNSVHPAPFELKDVKEQFVVLRAKNGLS